ncbi:MAG: Jag N-terminal domain-containing protein [Campylobacterota bacterium]|nr:Jag N-terminal domain-containing protein [Campylobacterota bacterium]
MIKIEAITLEEAYQDAALKLECSVTELAIEVVQHPKSGILGLFKKKAIIVATVDTKMVDANKSKNAQTKEKAKEVDAKLKKAEAKPEKKVVEEVVEKVKEEPSQRILNDTIMPASFVSDQDDEDDDLESGLSYTADYDDEFDEKDESEDTTLKVAQLAQKVDKEINELFDLTCFKIDKIEVSAYDSETLLIEFKGEDAALLIGKEGYRYKALSYMIFNWINSKYDVQLRLEIAEFLKNQEESISRYLVNVCENIDKDGRAQTKILDGVLVQIALKELRDKYPDKYVVIRSTRDGLKYIIVNDYHNN